MSIGAVILAILQLALLVIKKVFTRSAEIKEKLKDAQNEIKEGIKKRDASRVTAGFARAKRLRK